MTNLIRNGSFEDGIHQIDSVAGLTNWSNWASSAPDALDGVTPSRGNINGSDGSGYVFLASRRTDLTQFSEAVVQTLATPLQDGDLYTLTLDFLTSDFGANDIDGVANVNLYSVEGNNATVIATIPIDSGLGWQEDQSLTFRAPTDVSRVAISSSEGPGFLDNVRLTAGGDLGSEPDIGEAEVNGRVWFDTNENGLFDDGEPGVSNVGVILLEVDGNDVVQQDARTDANGNYSFTGLSDTNYQIRLGTDLGDDIGITSSNVGSDDTIDSDLITTNRTVGFAVNAGQRRQSFDIGLTGTINLAPTVEDVTATTQLGTSVTIDVLANDTGAKLQSTNDNGGDGFIPVREATGNIGNGITHTATSNTNGIFDLFNSDDFLVGDAQSIFGGSNERHTHTFSEEVDGVRLEIIAFGSFVDLVASETAEFSVDGQFFNLNTALANGTAILEGDAGATVNSQGQLFNRESSFTGSTTLTINRPLTSFSIDNVSAGGKGAGINYSLEAKPVAEPLDTTPPAVTIDGVGSPLNGTVEVVNGQIVYTPDAGFAGTETFAYRASSEGGPGAIGQVSVTVVDPNPNTAPEAVDDIATTPFNTPITLDVLANDTDAQADQTLSIDAVGNPASGTAEIVDGQLLYTPETNFAGTSTFAYRVSDGNGGTDIGEVTVTVEPPVATASISGQVRNDVDSDGDLSDNDAGIAGVTIQLFEDTDRNFRADGEAIATTITDASGNYSFGGLVNGNYVVEQTNLVGFTSTADVNGFNPDRIAGIRVNGRNVVGQNFLDVVDNPGFSINGQVRSDVDSDGDLSDSDAGIFGVTLQLFADADRNFRPDGEAIATTTTDANGNYSFTGLANSSYIVEQINLAGFTSTADVNGFNPDRIVGIQLNDRNVNGRDFLDAPGPTSGFSIFGQVRNDVDGDGDFGDTDLGISGVTLQLFEDADLNFRPDGEAIATTTTDANGNYVFSDLSDGGYVVEQINLDGFISTADANGFNLDRIGGIRVNGSDVLAQDFLDQGTALVDLGSARTAGADTLPG